MSHKMITSQDDHLKQGHWAMAGVTERPFQLGDPIYKFVRTATGAQEIEWHITEHDRPHHAKLQAEDGLIGVVVVALATARRWRCCTGSFARSPCTFRRVVPCWRYPATWGSLPASGHAMGPLAIRTSAPPRSASGCRPPGLGSPGAGSLTISGWIHVAPGGAVAGVRADS